MQDDLTQVLMCSVNEWWAKIEENWADVLELIHLFFDPNSTVIDASNPHSDITQHRVALRSELHGLLTRRDPYLMNYLGAVWAMIPTDLRITKLKGYAILEWLLDNGWALGPRMAHTLGKHRYNKNTPLSACIEALKSVRELPDYPVITDDTDTEAIAAVAAATDRIDNAIYEAAEALLDCIGYWRIRHTLSGLGVCPDCSTLYSLDANEPTALCACGAGDWGGPAPVLQQLRHLMRATPGLRHAFDVLLKEF